LLKKLVSFFLIFSAIFFLITLWNHAIGFIRSNTLNIESENVSYIPVEVKVKGFPIFRASPIYSQSAGKVEFKVVAGNFVEKNTVIGVLTSGEKREFINSPASGIFLNYAFKKYENTVNNSLLDSNNEPFLVKGNSYVQPNEILGSVIIDNSFYVCLKDVKINDSKKNLVFILDDGFSEIRGTVVKIEGDNTFVLIKDYLNYFLGKNEFRVRTDIVKGILVEGKKIVERNGKKGILIVNGNRISFLETTLVPLGDGRFVAEVNDYNALLIVKNVRFLGENEIIGGF